MIVRISAYDRDAVIIRIKFSRHNSNILTEFFLSFFIVIYGKMIDFGRLYNGKTYVD